jgi:nucleoside 2-deoxyribosyltransferase
MCKICGFIQQAEYVLADLSGERVNVGYEIGIAHGLGKETFIIRDKESAEVSDLKRNEMISYDDFEKLQEDFIQMFSDTTGRLTASQ